MSVGPGAVLEAAAEITVDTFSLLADIMTDPWSAHAYCDAVGVPAFSGGEWSDAVGEMRAALANEQDPERYARAVDLIAKVINGLHKAIAGGAPGDPGKLESFVLKILTPLLLKVTRDKWPVIHAILALAFLTDQRLQDSFAEGLFADRWYHVLGSLAGAAGWGRTVPQDPDDPTGPTVTVVDWAPIVSDSVAVATTIAAVVVNKKGWLEDHLIRFWYGFDQPEIEGQEEARALAQHAFTVLLDDDEPKVTAADYDAGLHAQRAAQPSAPLGITLVPVPSKVDAPTKLLIQIHGESHIDEPLGGDVHFTMTNGATFAVLASSDGVETVGDVSFQAEVVRQWTPEPAATQDAVEFQASKLAIGAAVNIDGPRAWLRVEK